MTGAGSPTNRPSFPLPGDLRPGRRLLTAGLKGTALEAVAVLEVLAPLDDCNGNGIDDSAELVDGGAQDVDGDGTPDDCQVGTMRWMLRGAAAGGTLTVTLAGFSGSCTVTIPTTAGSSAETVAAELAAALNADSCTNAQGFGATAMATSVEVRGFLLRHVSTVLDDPQPGAHDPRHRRPRLDRTRWSRSRPPPGVVGVGRDAARPGAVELTENGCDRRWDAKGATGEVAPPARRRRSPAPAASPAPAPARS